LVKYGIFPAQKLMSGSPFKILGLLLPNLFFLYAASWSGWRLYPERRESFGSQDIYLDIHYSGLPRVNSVKGISNSEEFEGVIATDTHQSEVLGKKVKIQGVTWYTFYMGDKKFLGRLAPSEKGCEPQLQYHLEKEGKIVKTGVMKAGFCL
jgi:hypothetical protein